MTWNWQQSDWPRLTWDTAKLERFERLFAEGGGVLVGTRKHLDSKDQETLMVEVMSFEALDTSAIEGEILSRDSVQFSIRLQLGLTSDRRRVKPAESGIAELMISLYQNVHAPLTAQVLFDWHKMITNGRRDLSDIGQYRHHKEPMQIVSGADYAPRVHFEAPPSAQVPSEMETFLTWFKDTGRTGKQPLPPVTRAGMAHLWFESIHPFEDGNGRIGRAIVEKALAQGLQVPQLTAVAGTVLRYRKAYYQNLEQASRTLDITQWLLWFATVVLEAQHRSIILVEFVLHKAKLMTHIKDKLNERQEKALRRLFDAGPDGFIGGLSAGNYMRITGAPSASATRDLTELVKLGALYKTGGHKATRYHLVVHHTADFCSVEKNL